MFPESTEARDAIAPLGEGFERVGILTKAADHYELLARRFPQDARSRELLVRAMCLRSDLGQDDQARQDAQLLLRNYRQKASPRSDCPAAEGRYARVVAASLRTAVFREQCDAVDHACRCEAICKATVIRPDDGGAQLRYPYAEGGSDGLSVAIDSAGSITACHHTRSDAPQHEVHRVCARAP